ncbi:glycine cleavage system protein GcvH [Kitasatospora aureofaciens]|uniref:glycine cleavage system protein GcvH n=1 Tax=Kitasatospora aureofaciens TaxID=1894 RepID=UPI0033D7CE74
MPYIPSDLRFSSRHAWARLEADGTVTAGLSDWAQMKLGNIFSVQLAEVGGRFPAGGAAGVVESAKAAVDYYSPVGGEVIAVNEELSDRPGLINSDPYGAWMFKLQPSDPAEFDKLLDAAAYRAALDE